jgi:two-component SAPR family response regulator
MDNLLREDPVPTSQQQGSISILIVEDELLIAQHLKEIIVKEDRFHVMGVLDNGRRAVELAVTMPPDLILMDIHLKGDLNGVEAAIIIQGKLNRKIPIVFLTAFPANEYPYLMVVEPYLYINKPFTDQQVLQSIERALKLN